MRPALPTGPTAPLLALLAGCAASPGPAPAPAPATAGPPPVAVVDGEPITQEDYRDYLYAIYGPRLVRDLVTVRLLEREADRLGLTPSQEELEEATTTGIADLIQTRYGGDRQRFLDALQRDDHNEETYRRYYRTRKWREMLQRRVTRATRAITPELLNDVFEERYGPGGVNVTVRHVVLAVPREKIALQQQGVPPEERTDEAVRQRLVQRAGQILEELRGGADFADVACRESHDNQACQTGGAIEGYRYLRYGPVFAEAVRSAEVGELVGPVVCQQTVHVLQVTSRVVTRYEDVAAEVERIAREREPDLDEILAEEERLREAAEIVYP